MKKKLSLALCTLFAIAIIPISASATENPMGILYKDASQAGGGSGSVCVTKVGSAQCISYFGMVAQGDCSITTAMRNGKISSLSHYDEKIYNILGYKKITVKAYGQ